MILSPQWCNDSVVLVAVLRCLSILSFLILSSLLLLPVLLLLEWTEYLTTTNEWQFCSQQLTAVPSCAIALSLSSSQLPSGVVHGINSFDISFICIQNLWICDDLISVQQLMSFIALSMSAYDDISHAWYLTNMVSTSNVINVRVSSSSLQLTLMVCGASVVLVMLCSYFHSSTFDVCVVIHRHTSTCSNAVCLAATLSVLCEMQHSWHNKQQRVTDDSCLSQVKYSSRRQWLCERFQCNMHLLTDELLHLTQQTTHSSTNTCYMSLYDTHDTSAAKLSDTSTTALHHSIVVVYYKLTVWNPGIPRTKNPGNLHIFPAKNLGLWPAETPVFGTGIWSISCVKRQIPIYFDTICWACNLSV